jgi:HK97 family phage major capsid protein
MNKNKEYRSQLKAQRALLLGKVSAYETMQPSELNAREVEDFADAQWELRNINTALTQARQPVDELPPNLGSRVPGKKGGKSERNRAFANYLRTGETRGVNLYTYSGNDVAYIETRDGPGLSTAPMDMGATPGATGQYAGYLVAPDFWSTLAVAMKAFGGLSNSFKQLQTPTGALMPFPTTDPTNVVASPIASELTQLNVTSPYVFGQGMLAAWPYVIGPVLASLQLVNDAAFPVDQFVSDRFGEALGRELASLAYSGTGSGQPLGIITALAARGAVTTSGGYYQLGTATTVKTFAGSTTELTGNVLAPQSLIAMVQNVDPAYYPNSKWFFNSTMAWNLRQVVDSNGRPILNFMNGFSADDVTSADYTHGSAVAQLFGFPVVIDNAIGNLAASTVGGPIFGDLSRAMVMRTVKDSTTVLRLSERYADYLAIGYLGFSRVDMRSNDLRAAITARPAAT